MKDLTEKEKWDKIIDAGTKRNGFSVKNLWNYRDLVLMFIKKDIIIYYKQTILGPLWFLIQPLISTVIYMFIFGTLADIGTDGVPQILFYYSGTMLWTFFSETFLKTANVFNDNKAMFGKIYFPRLVVPFSIVVVNMIKLFIQCILFTILFFYTIYQGYAPVISWRILLLPIVILWIGALAMGLGLIVTSITTKYRDLALVLNHMVSLLMYATPVVYPLSEVPGNLGKVLVWNPMSAPLEIFRSCIFGVGEFPSEFWMISVFVCILIVAYGFHIFARNEKSFVDVI